MSRLLVVIASVVLATAAPAQPTTAELLTRIERLEKTIGLIYMTGAQLSESTFKATQLNPTNELASGDYNLGVGQKLTNYILRDQRDEITALKERMPPDNRTVQEYVNSAVASARPVYNISGTVAGSVPGYGNGVIMQTPNGLHTLFFTSDYDRATRLVTNPCTIQMPVCDRSLGSHSVMFEQDGAMAFAYDKPPDVPAGQFDWPNSRGKQILFRPAGHNDLGQAGIQAEIVSGLLGRNLVLGVARTYPNVLDYPYGDFKIVGLDAANPIRITLDYESRKLVRCGQQVCWQ